jgi:hypothetical protein
MGELVGAEGAVEDVGDGDALATRGGAVFSALHALIRIDDPTRRPTALGRFITR